MIVSIDPGSHTLGLAIFKEGTHELVNLFGVEGGEYGRMGRQDLIVRRVLAHLQPATFISDVIIEDPFVQGAAIKPLQRLIGALEYALKENFAVGRFFYLSPTTVKKWAGSGHADKQTVARKVLALSLFQDSQYMVEHAISREAWDETDAVAIGMTFLAGNYYGKEES